MGYKTEGSCPSQGPTRSFSALYPASQVPFCMQSHSLSVDQTYSLCNTSTHSFQTDGAKALNRLPGVPLQATESLSPHWENKREVLHTIVLLYGAALPTSHQRCPLPLATTAPGTTCSGLRVCTPHHISVLFTAGPQPLYTPVGSVTSANCNCLNKNQTLPLNFVFSFSGQFSWLGRPPACCEWGRHWPCLLPSSPSWLLQKDLAPPHPEPG